MKEQQRQGEQQELSPRGEPLDAQDPEEAPLSVACPTVDPMRSFTSQEATSEVDFDALYREQKGRVLGTVRSVLGPSDEIEDVVQLVFIEVHRSLRAFEGRAKLSTWVYRIAVNVALQHIRRKKRRRWLMLGATGDEGERLSTGGRPELRLEDRELLERVYAAADRLSEKKRTVWVLHELQGLSPSEVSEVLEIPMNTVRSRLLAARKEIKGRLERDGALSQEGGR
jgi:RNA polymerase sigma-70 factor (ECF subfamily)